jgi:hypothetical protein
MSSRRQRSQLLGATPLHLHSLRRERTGMITTCGRNEKAPCTAEMGDRASGEFGPSSAIVAEPESDYQPRRGSRH